MSINDYKRKLDDANRSPNKKAALGSWKTSIFTIKDAATAPPIKKWIESIADGAKVLQLLAPSVAGLAYLADGKNVQVLSLPALSTDQTKLVGHAGTDFEDNTMPCGLDINDITGNVLSIVDKPLAEQAKFVFIDTNLNAGPLVIGTGTRANNNTWDLSSMIPDELQGADKFPVLALLPKTIPLTYTEPPVGELDNDDVQRQLQAIDDSALAWATGIEALVDKANGESLTGNKSIDVIISFFPEAQRETVKKALSPPMISTSIYCKQHVVLGDDNQVIHEHLNKEGNAHMASFFASNKEARDAFKSPPTKTNEERGFDTERLSKMTFTLEDGSKGFSKDTKDSHVAALKLLCAKFKKDDDEWTFPTEEELHPAAAELMKSGAKPDTPSMMLRKLSALQRALVENHPDTKIGMEANPTMMNRANWMLFGRTDWRDEPFRSADDFNESSTWSTFNVISEASGRSATKELAEEEKAKAMVGKEIVSTTNPTRAVDCHEILQAVECIANT